MTIGIDASRANRVYKTGTEWYSYYLIKNLAEIDHKNRYILYTDQPLAEELAQIVRQHKNFTARCLKWPSHYFWTLGRLSLEMLFRRPRVLFVPAHSIPLIHPRRTITTIHDIAFKREGGVYLEQTVDRGSHFWRSFLVSLIKHFSLFTGQGYKYDSTTYLDWSTRYALRHAKKIITVSNYTKEEIERTYQVRSGKITVIHNGYNNLLYRKNDEPAKLKAILEKYGLNFPYLLYVGRLEKKKNIPMLLEAFALLRENNPEIKTKLVLIGHAGFGYDEIKYIIEEYDLNSEVLLLGWVAEADLPHLHHGSQAFVFPSRHEGFGIPVIQALACGVPTAVSDIPVLREVAGEAALYFNKESKNDIAEKLKDIISDDKLRADLVRRGYERASHFSWRKCAEETLEAIKAL